MPRSLARTLVLALASAACVTALSPFATASSSAVSPIIDERVDGLEKALLESSVGYAIPEFDDHVEWLGNERPSFEELRGKVVVLNTWDSLSTDGSNITRRVSTLLRRFGDDVQQVALHTPEDADELIKKYKRFNGRLPVPLAVDTKGAYLDELGVFREPRIIIIDRDGRIAHAGVSLAQLRDAVQRTLNVEATITAAPEPLPARDGRVEAPEPDLEEVEAGWPEFNRIQAGSAVNLQGQEAPELVVTSYLNGPAPETEGKVVMMEFWATWCGPCIVGIPHLNDLQSEFENDLVIVGISAEDEAHVRSKLSSDRRLNFGYVVAVDPLRRVQNEVGNRGIPHCIVVSSDGIVRWQGHPARLTDDVLGQIVRKNREITGVAVGAGGRWVQES